MSASITSRSAAEILLSYRITTAATAPGRYYAICPQCSSSRKKAHQKLKCLGVTIDDKGVSFGCNHCPWIGGEYYRRADRPRQVRHMALLPPIARTTLEASEQNRKATSIALWNAASDPRVPSVLRYFERRRLELTDNLVQRVVRFHPSCPFGPGVRHAAIITAFRSIADDSLQAIQRTALTADGQKIGRLSLGPMSGAAIKIDDDTDVAQGLTICEGFETGLAGRMLGFGPVWAVGSAGAIGKFPVLPGINALTILGETDDSGDNANAVRICARNWIAAGHEAAIVTPQIAGDMNDVLVMP